MFCMPNHNPNKKFANISMILCTLSLLVVMPGIMVQLISKSHKYYSNGASTAIPHQDNWSEKNYYYEPLNIVS